METESPNNSKRIQELLKKNLCSANSILDQPVEIISLSPILDDILGGGLKAGSATIMTGVYKGGKTATCLHISKKFQEAGKKVYYVSVEHRLTKRDLLTHNIDTDPTKFQIIQSVEGSILSGEDFLRIMYSKMESEKNILMVVDSYSTLCSEELLSGDIADRFRDPMPLKLSAFCKAIPACLTINHNTIIGITHEIANQSPMSRKKTMEASGVKLQYQADFKLRVSHSTPIKEDDTNQIGQVIHWTCLTSALGPPNRSGDGKLYYDRGIDEVVELIDLGILTGAIKKSGSWIKYEDKSIQGVEKFTNFVKQDRKVFESIRDQVFSTI